MASKVIILPCTKLIVEGKLLVCDLLKKVTKKELADDVAKVNEQNKVLFIKFQPL